MSMPESLWFLFALLAGPALAQPADIGLGEPLTAAQLEPYAITVFPDGRGLPPGQGNARAGALVYARQCAACHGARGIEGPAARLAGSDGFIAWSDPLRPLRILKYPLLVQSVGARWPYATTLFDYVRRAMPYHAPRSLSADELYAVTAHVLHLNGLVDEQTLLHQGNLAKVRMPALERSVSAWPAPP
ncbi:c-type cytochrome [Paucibacter soli]|uniref:c-type cytochrome n=1 Tax=Paucibacter soli TaxID=3133433 RepID=UPI0030B7B53D